MGCDISAAIERRVDDRWTADQPLKLARNYHLFGILAGVRRDHEPIAPPRGLPGDLDPKSCAHPHHKDPGGCCRGGADEFGDHTHSWLTLAELRAYDWTKTLPDMGCIPLRDVDRRPHDVGFYKETYVDWRKTPPHFPDGCCGGLSSAIVLDLRPWEFVDASDPDEHRKRIFDQRRAERLLADPDLMPEPEDPPPGALYEDQGGLWKRGEKRPLVAWAVVAWELPAREYCRQFCEWMDAQDAPGDDLRIVFGFSS